jgi:hypothetical protein
VHPIVAAGPFPCERLRIVPPPGTAGNEGDGAVEVPALQSRADWVQRVRALLDIAHADGWAGWVTAVGETTEVHARGERCIDRASMHGDACSRADIVGAVPARVAMAWGYGSQLQLCETSARSAS